MNYNKLTLKTVKIKIIYIITFFIIKFLYTHFLPKAFVHAHGHFGNFGQNAHAYIDINVNILHLNSIIILNNSKSYKFSIFLELIFTNSQF